MYCDSVVIHTILQNSGNPFAKLMILQSAVIKVVQVRLNEPSDVSNEACKERYFGVLGGNRAAFPGAKKCSWPRRGTLFRIMRFPSALDSNSICISWWHRCRSES